MEEKGFLFIKYRLQIADQRLPVGQVVADPGGGFEYPVFIHRSSLQSVVKCAVKI